MTTTEDVIDEKNFPRDSNGCASRGLVGHRRRGHRFTDHSKRFSALQVGTFARQFSQGHSESNHNQMRSTSRPDLAPGTMDTESTGSNPGEPGEPGNVSREIREIRHPAILRHPRDTKCKHNCRIQNRKVEVSSHDL